MVNILTLHGSDTDLNMILSIILAVSLQENELSGVMLFYNWFLEVTKFYINR